MIHFFRRIRQGLLSQNRFSKYMLYAVGEILLVMIGILLALQVNNWNTDRLNRIEVEEIIASLESDLRKDISMLTKAIENAETQLEANNKLINRYNSENVTIESFKVIISEFDPKYGSVKSFYNTTLNSIESTGKIELLDNKFKNELFEYKRQQESVLNTEASNIVHYNSFISNFLAKYTFSFFHNSKFVDQLNSQFVNEQEYVNLMVNVIGYKSEMTITALIGRRNALEKAENLITSIQSYKND